VGPVGPVEPVGAVGAVGPVGWEDDLLNSYLGLIIYGINIPIRKINPIISPIIISILYLYLRKSIGN
jgi:hypothetical protein